MVGKILVVDDEPDIVETLKARLELEGYDVVTANCGEECVSVAVAAKPDLIVLDVLLPDLDGGVVAQKLKDDPRTSNIPVIFLTCIVKPEETQCGQKKIGDNLFIAKPFKTDTIVTAVKKYLKR